MSCASNQKFPWEAKQTSQSSCHSSEHSGISPLGIPVYELYEEPGLFTVRSNFSPLMVLPSLILHLGSEWFCYFQKTQPEDVEEDITYPKDNPTEHSRILDKR